MGSESKQAKLNELELDKADRQRMYECLPLHIFREHTNIRQLIIDKFVAQKGKQPTEFHIKQTVKNVYNKIVTNDLDDPLNELIDEVDFIWPNGEKRCPKMWTLTKIERDIIYKKASFYQKKFIYLPRHVLEQATNMRKVMEEHAIIYKRDLKKLDAYIKGVCETIHLPDQWYKFMLHFKFNDEVESDTDVIEEQNEPVRNERTTQRDEPSVNAPKRADAREKRTEFKRKEANSHQNERINVAKRSKDNPTNTKETPSSSKDNSSNSNENLREKPPTNSMTTVQQKSNSNRSQNDDSKHSARSNSLNEIDGEPSEFQKEVIAMDYDTFVKQTNVSDLVKQDYQKQKGNQELKLQNLEFGLKFYFRFKNKPGNWKKWHRNSIKNLKYKTCECQRNKMYQNNSTQTNEAPHFHEIAIQCSENDIDTSLKRDKNSGRLVGLSIQHISDATIHIQCENQSNEPSSICSSDSEHNLVIDESAMSPQDETKDNIAVSRIESDEPSQQIAQVRMSQFNDVNDLDQEEQLSNQNPLESETTLEMSIEPITVNQIQETTYASGSIGSSSFRISPIESRQNVNIDERSKLVELMHVETLHNNNVTKQEPNSSLEYRVGDDSDVEYMGPMPELILEISDDLSTQEQHMQLNFEGSDDLQPEFIHAIQMPEHGRNIEQLICLTSTPVEKTSRLKNIVNVQTTRTRPIRNRRPAIVPRVTRGRRKANEETLSTIQVPKYTYAPLRFNGQPTVEMNQANIFNDPPMQIDESQSSSDHSRNYEIEESSYMDGDKSRTTVTLPTRKLRQRN
ncbi:uncharacterized protein LOC116345692 isoform X2 [Contarinia nasturtii]|uniref:uncharacterized protein LOC116345692 isoform X2 n=1 Tax=Contarinia nasturtii TaxID=265458 RepID=UPI0012D40BE2|nr:uncharacterized protein LOC116345692 isoform X2 [Contarinia nasturtii]